MTVRATNAAAVKQALRALIADLPLGDVQVGYGPPANPERDMVYLGRLRGRYSVTAMRGGGPLPRTEELTVPVVIVVVLPGGGIEDAEARAVELADTVIAGVAADPLLGGVDGLRIIKPVGSELDSGADDDAAMAWVTLTFEALSHLQ